MARLKWRETLYTPLKKRLFDAVNGIVTRDRQGELVDKSLVQRMVGVYGTTLMTSILCYCELTCYSGLRRLWNRKWSPRRHILPKRISEAFCELHRRVLFEGIHWIFAEQRVPHNPRTFCIQLVLTVDSVSAYMKKANERLRQEEVRTFNSHYLTLLHGRALPKTSSTPALWRTS